jgi:hypothetical protein
MKYSWLEEEAEKIHWRRFFEFKDNADEKSLEKLELKVGTLPSDFKQFVLKFGDVNLFRNRDRDSYLLSVMSQPRVRKNLQGEILLEFGFFLNSGYAYFRRKASVGSFPDTVFEGTNYDRLRMGEKSFEEWLKTRFKRARKLYKKSEWLEIIKGASPFTIEELDICEAIPNFTFKKIGIAEDGDILIEVHNASDRYFDFLTVGVKVPGCLEGAVFLDVSRIGPSATGIIKQNCYKESSLPKYVQLFRKKLPEPEDREMYAEFRKKP